MKIEASSSPSPSPSPSPQQSQVVARKLWNIVRIVFVMLRKGIAKSKLGVDFKLHLLLKRGKLAATKAIANTIISHNNRFSKNDTVVYPRDYEFSCSNSPAFPFHVIKRTNKTRKFPHYDDVSKVLEMLNNNNKVVVESSPLPGFDFGKKLRVTDSPFPLKDEEQEDNQVDVAAEEFIKRFYKDLNLQQKMAANSWDR